MTNKPYNIDYELSHYDEWNNQYVLCPVCGFTFCRDGVLKHIIRTAQVGEQTHTVWLEKKKIPWNKELREAFKQNKK